MKKCSKCGETKTLDEFGEISRELDGKNSHCKSCVNIYAREHYKNNSKKIQERARRYKKTHRDGRLEEKLQVTLPNGNQKRIYGKDINLRKLMQHCESQGITSELILRKPSKHKTSQFILEGARHKRRIVMAELGAESKALSRQAYYRAHREERLAYNKERRRTNAAYYEEYRKNNPEKFRAAARRRRAKKEEVNEDFTSMQAVFVRHFWDNRCAICGDHQEESGKVFHIDHWFPLSKGHAMTISNAVLMCPSCNFRKHADLPSEAFDSEVVQRIEKKIAIQARMWKSKIQTVA